MFDKFKTYSGDLPLLKKLGLAPFEGDTHSEIYVGEVKTEYGYGYVKVWVTGSPAQSFKFEVYCEETNETSIMETGSGTLTDFWSIAESIMEGMITIETKSK